MELSSVKGWIKKNHIKLVAKQKGWNYIMSWVHRISGVLLVAYALLHIKTLSLLNSPESYDIQMVRYSGPIFIFLEWLLAIPVMLHAANGACLILYESFGYRKNEFLLKSVFVYSGIFLLILGVMAILGNQEMSPVAFWLPLLAIGLSVCTNLISRMISAGLPWTFVFQRVSGAFLLIMIPAHLFFMHLSPNVSKSAAVVISRMKLPIIAFIDTALVAAVLYHSAYGIISIILDYFPKGKDRTTFLVFVIFVFSIIAYKGFLIIWTI